MPAASSAHTVVQLEKLCDIKVKARCHLSTCKWWQAVANLLDFDKSLIAIRIQVGDFAGVYPDNT